MGRFSDLRVQFDPVNQKRKGDQFESVCKWFLENDTGQYKQLLRRVWFWKDWPGNWGIDAGIDLVAEDTEGRLWAIQAKAYANTVTRTEVNKFLTEASRFDFAHRVLMATTDKLSSTAQRTMEDLGVTFIGLTELEDFTEWPTKLTDLRPARVPEARKPHDYQRDAIKDVVQGFKTADRGQLIMACGTGKTLTAWFIKEKLAATRTLVLVPSLSLLKQTMREWRTANTKRPFDALPVCSDETVARDEDAAISHVSYLGEPADTDPEIIAAFLRKRSGPRVVFATYQSSPQIAAAFTLGRVPKFDLVIADEAHRCAGPTSSGFGTVLAPEQIKGRRRLFMTATPRYYTGRIIRAAKEAEDEIASMDDHTKFGEVFHRLSFGKAIERKLLTDYQVAIIGVDDVTYRDWAERGALVKMGDKRTDARSLAGQIGLAKAMRKYELRRMITFHGRVKAARDFASSMPDVLAWMPARQRPKGKLWSQYASGEMSAGQRHILLQHLKRLNDGERGLLANARCLAEGVDVPSLDGVAFIDPRRSEVDIVQAVGRAIRLSDDKVVGTIVIPVFIDDSQDAEVALDDSAFKPVWDVIKALRAHDEELGEQLDGLRRQLGRRGKITRLPDKIRLDLPVSVSIDFARAFDIRLVEQTTRSWELWFGFLEQFVEKHGHARVPAPYKVDGYRLGAWASAQRGLYARRALDANRQQRLNELPGWTWDPHADSWEEGFSRLQQYVERHGHARVPQSYQVDGFRLGAWITKQRGAYSRGALEVERQQRLKELHGWSWEPRAARWDEGFSRLRQYVERHGHARVPDSYEIDGFGLGKWVGRQRTLYSKGALETDRLQRLGKLPGWTWDPYAASWEEGFSRLQQYVERHGHALVPDPYEVDGFKLGSWVGRQRTLYSRGALEADRLDRLKGLRGWTWDPHAASWEEGFSRLQQYVERHGHARVPTSYRVDGYKLGLWASAQRTVYSKGTLDADRQQRLKGLPGWSWDARAARWDEGFSRLQQYVERHGHARVPQSYQVDGFKLGLWVGTQRTVYSKGTLDADRQQRLKGLPGWIWDSRTARWEEGFSRLQQYVERHGHARVPQSYQVDGYNLGSWVGTQRAFYSRGALEADRQQRLKELPGWTWKTR